MDKNISKIKEQNKKKHRKIKKITKKNKRNKKNNKRKNKKKTQLKKISSRNNYKKIIKPSTNPKKLPLNKMSVKNGTLFKISTYNDKKIWKKANKLEIECHDYLTNKINYNISEYKKGKYKSSKQAIAIAYSQTQQKYPTCKM